MMTTSVNITSANSISEAVKVLLEGRVLFPSNAEKQRYLSKLLAAVDRVEGDPYHVLDGMKSFCPKQVCQYQFKANDIVWICKQCQKDETCVLCNECYQESDHTGHEVYFYHSTYGGCCDCGDSYSWNPAGFCKNHGNKISDPIKYIPESTRERARSIFKVIISNLVEFNVYFKTTFASDFDPASTSSGPHTNQNFHVFLYFDEFHKREDVQQLFQRPDIVQFLGKRIIIDDRMWELGKVMLLTGNKETVRAAASYLREQLQVASVSPLHLNILSENDRIRMDATINSLVWMSRVSEINDGFCKLIVTSFSLPQLIILLQVDLRSDRIVQNVFHDMILTLMADPAFKTMIGVAYVYAYNTICSEYAQAIGQNGKAIYHVSVQYLNRDHWVYDLCYRHDFLAIMTNALLEMLCVGSTNANNMHGAAVGYNENKLEMLNLKHGILTYRRYTPIVGDLKLVFTIPGIARLFLTGGNLQTFLRILGVYQCMHVQRRATRVHVDYEETEWMQAFNLYLSLASMFDPLLEWFGAADSTVNARRASVPALPEALALTAEDEMNLVDIIAGAETAKAGQLVSSTDGSYAAAAAVETGDDLNVAQSATHRAGGAASPTRLQGLSKFMQQTLFGRLNAGLSGHRARQFPQQSVAQNTGAGAGDNAERKPKSPVAAAVAANVAADIDALLSFAAIDDCGPAEAATLSIAVPTIESADVAVDGAVNSNLPSELFSVTDVMRSILVAIMDWQQDSNRSSRIVALSPICGGAILTVKSQFEENTVSFHLMLHRFLTSCVLEACKHAHCTAALRDLQHCLDLNTSHLGTLIDCPLACLATASQIRIGMWRRNGQVAGDQLLNYAEAPFCFKYRDRDIHLVQFTLCRYPPKFFIAHLFHRFGLQCHIEAYHLGRGCHVTAKTDPDYSYLTQLMDECLHLLINIVTELPAPPKAKGKPPQEAMAAALRREILHRLVGGPATFAQLQECVGGLPDFQKIDPPDLLTFISGIAQRQTASSALAPPTFVLKKENWVEYDPCFPRTQSSAHQSAIEYRPRLNAEQPSPMVLPPPVAHTIFWPVRPLLLFDRSLLVVLRDLLHNIATQHLSGTEGAKYKAVAGPDMFIMCSESCLTKVLQLLTLALHCAAEEQPAEVSFCTAFVVDEKETEEEEEEERGGGGGGGLYTSVKMQSKLGKFFIETPPSLHLLDMQQKPATTPLMTVNLPSLLDTLLDLHSNLLNGSSHARTSLDANNACWMGWIVQRIGEYDSRCAARVEAYKVETQSQNAAREAARAEAERKKAAARNAAMAMMQKSSASFLAMMNMSDSEDEDDDDDEDEENDRLAVGARAVAATDAKSAKKVRARSMSNGENDSSIGMSAGGVEGVTAAIEQGKIGGGSNSNNSENNKDGDAVCIICQGPGGNSPEGALGLVGLTQSSSVMASQWNMQQLLLSKHARREKEKMESEQASLMSSSSSTAAAATTTLSWANTMGSSVRNEGGSSKRDILSDCMHLARQKLPKPDANKTPKVRAYPKPLPALGYAISNPDTTIATVEDGVHSGCTSCMHTSFCGHMIHFGCFEVYMGDHARRQHQMILDHTRNQFQCPLCQQLSNVLVPYSSQPVDSADIAPVTSMAATTATTTPTTSEVLKNEASSSTVEDSVPIMIDEHTPPCKSSSSWVQWVQEPSLFFSLPSNVSASGSAAGLMAAASAASDDDQAVSGENGVLSSSNTTGSLLKLDSNDIKVLRGRGVGGRGRGERSRWTQAQITAMLAAAGFDVDSELAQIVMQHEGWGQQDNDGIDEEQEQDAAVFGVAANDASLNDIGIMNEEEITAVHAQLQAQQQELVGLQQQTEAALSEAVAAAAAAAARAGTAVELSSNSSAIDSDVDNEDGYFSAHEEGALANAHYGPRGSDCSASSTVFSCNSAGSSSAGNKRSVSVGRDNDGFDYRYGGGAAKQQKKTTSVRAELQRRRYDSVHGTIEMRTSALLNDTKTLHALGVVQKNPTSSSSSSSSSLSFLSLERQHQQQDGRDDSDSDKANAVLTRHRWAKALNALVIEDSTGRIDAGSGGWPMEKSDVYELANIQRGNAMRFVEAWLSGAKVASTMHPLPTKGFDAGSGVDALCRLWPPVPRPNELSQILHGYINEWYAASVDNRANAVSAIQTAQIAENVFTDSMWIVEILAFQVLIHMGLKVSFLVELKDELLKRRKDTFPDPKCGAYQLLEHCLLDLCEQAFWNSRLREYASSVLDVSAPVVNVDIPIKPDREYLLCLEPYLEVTVSAIAYSLCGDLVEVEQQVVKKSNNNNNNSSSSTGGGGVEAGTAGAAGLDAGNAGSSSSTSTSTSTAATAFADAGTSSSTAGSNSSSGTTTTKESLNRAYMSRSGVLGMLSKAIKVNRCTGLLHRYLMSALCAPAPLSVFDKQWGVFYAQTCCPSRYGGGEGGGEGGKADRPPMIKPGHWISPIAVGGPEFNPFHSEIGVKINAPVPPVLSAPLLDFLVLSIAVGDIQLNSFTSNNSSSTSVGGGSGVSTAPTSEPKPDSGNETAAAAAAAATALLSVESSLIGIMNCARWLAVARLVQLITTEDMVQHTAKSTAEATSEAASLSSSSLLFGEAELLVNTVFSSVVSFMLCCETPSENENMDSKAIEHLHILSTVANGTTVDEVAAAAAKDVVKLPYALNSMAWKRVLYQWVSFLRAEVHILHSLLPAEVFAKKGDGRYSFSCTRDLARKDEYYAEMKLSAPNEQVNTTTTTTSSASTAYAGAATSGIIKDVALTPADELGVLLKVLGLRSLLHASPCCSTSSSSSSSSGCCRELVEVSRTSMSWLEQLLLHAHFHCDHPGQMLYRILRRKNTSSSSSGTSTTTTNAPATSHTHNKTMAVGAGPGEVLVTGATTSNSNSSSSKEERLAAKASNTEDEDDDYDKEDDKEDDDDSEELDVATNPTASWPNRFYDVFAAVNNPLVSRYACYPPPPPLSLLFAGGGSDCAADSNCCSFACDQVQLLPLPDDYTRLHAKVTALCRSASSSGNSEKKSAGSFSRATTSDADASPNHATNTLAPPLDDGTAAADVALAELQQDEDSAGAFGTGSNASSKAYAFPAMCLLCGAVIDAGGFGQCAAHLSSCTAGAGARYELQPIAGPRAAAIRSDNSGEQQQQQQQHVSVCRGSETGVFFLLQDGSILLSHGPRCAYYPTPYVDMFGECHHSYRGLPVRLDKNRYAALQRLWAKHEIPREIASKRSSLPRVIINGYF